MEHRMDDLAFTRTAALSVYSASGIQMGNSAKNSCRPKTARRSFATESGGRTGRGKGSLRRPSGEGRRVEHPMRELSWDPDSCLAMIGGELANGEVVARRSDGRVKQLITFQDGYRHGQARSYHPDGSLKEEGFYKYDRSVGTLRRWYRNGQLREEFISTDDGLKLLRHREWREDGTLKYDSNSDYDANIDSKLGTDV